MGSWGDTFTEQLRGDIFIDQQHCVEALLDGAGLAGAGSQPWPGRSGLFSPGASSPPLPIGVILRHDKPRMPVLDAFLVARPRLKQTAHCGRLDREANLRRLR